MSSPADIVANEQADQLEPQELCSNSRTRALDHLSIKVAEVDSNQTEPLACPLTSQRVSTSPSDLTIPATGTDEVTPQHRSIYSTNNDTICDADTNVPVASSVQNNGVANSHISMPDSVSAFMDRLISAVTSPITASPSRNPFSSENLWNNERILWSQIPENKLYDYLSLSGIIAIRGAQTEFKSNWCCTTPKGSNKLCTIIDYVVIWYVKYACESLDKSTEHNPPNHSDYSMTVSSIDMFFSSLNLDTSQSRVLTILATLGCNIKPPITLYDSIFKKSLLPFVYILGIYMTCDFSAFNEEDLIKLGSSITCQSKITNACSVQYHLLRVHGCYIIPELYKPCCQVMPGLANQQRKLILLPRSDGEIELRYDAIQSDKFPSTYGHWITKKDDDHLYFISKTCESCPICLRPQHVGDRSDKAYKAMLELVPERGIFELYFSKRLISVFLALVGAIAVAIYLAVRNHIEGVDPGGLCGNIVILSIAFIGFVREVFFPATELRDYLSLRVATAKFSHYCSSPNVCKSCVTALMIKNRASFGPVAAGQYASIAGGHPGPAETSKIFIDVPGDIQCFHVAGLSLCKRVQFLTPEFDRGAGSDEVRVEPVVLPPEFKRLVEYKGKNSYKAVDKFDYFLLAKTDNDLRNMTHLVYGVATIYTKDKVDQLMHVEWLPIPITGVALTCAKSF
ncbi:hypothetical protein GQ42DRAFT_16513 [Ramicandelaber brevisporus]|nr:hypothetical protein GQ42DRAFT_16513 [Ramicandelaber brevisporus]